MCDPALPWVPLQPWGWSPMVGVTPCVCHPQTGAGGVLVPGNSPWKALTAAQKVSSQFRPMGNAGRVLLKLFILCFQRLLSVLQPQLSTQEVPAVLVCSTSALAWAFMTVLGICGVPRRFGATLEIWQGPVLNEDSRPLVSLPVLAKWKKSIRENSFIVAC